MVHIKTPCYELEIVHEEVATCFLSHYMDSSLPHVQIHCYTNIQAL